jgi:predicted branched-subunit amino acid permease
LSVALAVTPFGVAFGIAATEAGLAVWQTSAFSLLVFTGSAQFAAVDVIGDGGSALSAIAAGALLNLRSLAFGVVMAGALRGPWWKRALWSQLMIDESTAVGSGQTDPAMRRYAYLVGGGAVFVSWNISTLVGAAALSSSGDLVTTWGLDAAIPAAFLALLWPRLADRSQRDSALLGAAIALVVLPVAPPGVPILAAGLGVLAGWRRSPPTPAVTPTATAAGTDAGTAGDAVSGADAASDTDAGTDAGVGR